MVKSRPFSIHTVHDMTAPGCFVMSELGMLAAVATPYPATFFERCVAAWWVLRKRAYAVRWPAPGELEAATNTTFKKKMAGKAAP